METLRQLADYGIAIFLIGGILAITFYWLRHMIPSWQDEKAADAELKRSIPHLAESLRQVADSQREITKAQEGISMIIIERKMKVGGSKRRRCQDETVGRVPRVAKLMALAIRFDQLIRNGVVADQAELARLGHVSRARLTQIMNLLNLAPDIQEKLLLLPATATGERDRIAERRLRRIAATASWTKQRQMLLWSSLA